MFTDFLNTAMNIIRNAVVNRSVGCWRDGPRPTTTTTSHDKYDTKDKGPIRVLMMGCSDVGKRTILYNSLCHHCDDDDDDEKGLSSTPQSLRRVKESHHNEECTSHHHRVTHHRALFTGFQHDHLTSPSTRLRVDSFDITTSLRGPREENTTMRDIERFVVTTRTRMLRQNVRALVFVVDAVGSSKTVEAEELHWYLQRPELQSYGHNHPLPVLVLANQRDLPHPLPLCEIPRALGLDALPNPWRLQGICATRDVGVHEAFRWITHGCPDDSVVVITGYHLLVWRELCIRQRASVRSRDDGGAKTLPHVLEFLMNVCSLELCALVGSFVGWNIDGRIAGVEEFISSS